MGIKSQKVNQVGCCVEISRPNTNDNEWLINHSCTVVKKATSKNNSAHITLRLKQLDEELAIQQREWDAERRAFEHEKRVLQIKYDLLQKHIAERTKASKGKKNSGDGEQNIAYNNTEGTLQSTNRTPPSEAFVNSSRKQQPVWKQTDLTRLNLPDDQLDEIQQRDIRAFLYTAPNNPNLIANRSEEMNEHNFTPIAHSTTTIGMPVRGKQTINNVCHDQWSKKRSSVPANIESLSKLTLLADDVAALAKSERNELSLAPSVQHSTSKDCRSYNKRSNAPSTFVAPIVPEPAPPPAQGDAAFPFIDGFLDRSMFRSENITSISEELVKSLLLSSALQSAPIPKYSKAITKIVNAGVQFFLGHVKAVEHLIQSQNMLKVMEFVTKLSIIVKMDLLSNKKTSNAVYYRVLYFTELTKPRTAVWLNSTPNGNVMSLTLSQKKCAHVSCCLQAEMCLVRCRQKKPVLPFDCDGGETSLMAVQWCENRGREQMKGQDDYWFTGIFVRREKSLGVCYSCPCWLEGSMKENGITNAVRMPQSTKIIAKMRTGMKTTTSITVPRMCVDGGILRVLMRGLLVVPGLCIEILSPDILVACRISIKPPIPIGATYVGIAEPLPAPVITDAGFTGIDLPQKTFAIWDIEETFSIDRLKKLRILKVSGCYKLTDFSLRYAFKFMELKELSLSRCHQLSKQGIEKLVTNCPALEYLDLSECPNINDNCVELIAQNLKRLSTLKLANCPLVSEVGLGYISEYCKNLKYLYVRGCFKLPPDISERLANITTLRQVYKS